MSGILAAAQSAGCCCRPQQGCTCSNPNRPGAIIDQSLTSVLVTSEFGIDEARRINGSPSDCLGCPCSAQFGYGQYGSYAYRAVGSVIDPDVAEGDCQGRGCTSGPCPSAPAYSCSAEVGGVVVYRGGPFVPGAQWSSRITFEGENRIGQWSWSPTQVGWCTPDSAPFLRVRSFFPFVYNQFGTQFGSLLSDPNGAFIDTSGNYAGTPYGNTVGRIIAVASASIGFNGFGFECAYQATVSIHYISEWKLRRFLAEPFFGLPFDATYSVSYRKPCLAPTDTVLGRYDLVADPQYDFYEQDAECGPLRSFTEIRQTLPQTLVVS